MSIVSLTTDVSGQVGNLIGGVTPRRVAMVTSDNLATITTAGYLNNYSRESGFALYPTDIIQCWYGYASNSSPGTFGTFTISISNGVITMVQAVNPGDVLLPVTSGDFAVFNGTTGQIKDAGYLPSNAAKTRVVMANGATIAGHIAVYADTTGTVSEDVSPAINAGSIQAGLSGTQGNFIAYPAGALAGRLIISAVGNTGNTDVTISNAIMGQAVVFTIADPGAATANLLVGETGSTLVSRGSAVVVAGGAAAQTVTDTFCTTASTVIANWRSTTNPVEIETVAAGNGSFVVTSTADPGASTIDYIIIK